MRARVPTRKNTPSPVSISRTTVPPPARLPPLRHPSPLRETSRGTAAVFPAAFFFRRIFRELAERSSSRVAGNRPVIRRTLRKNTEARKTDCNRAGSTGTPRIRCANNMCQKKNSGAEIPWVSECLIELSMLRTRRRVDEEGGRRAGESVKMKSRERNAPPRGRHSFFAPP